MTIDTHIILGLCLVYQYQAGTLTPDALDAKAGQVYQAIRVALANPILMADDLVKARTFAASLLRPDYARVRNPNSLTLLH